MRRNHHDPDMKAASPPSAESAPNVKVTSVCAGHRFGGAPAGIEPATPSSGEDPRPRWQTTWYLPRSTRTSPSPRSSQRPRGNSVLPIFIPQGWPQAMSHLPWNHQEPLCAPPFPQVTADRQGRSYGFSLGEGMRSLLVTVGCDNGEPSPARATSASHTLLDIPFARAEASVGRAVWVVSPQAHRRLGRPRDLRAVDLDPRGWHPARRPSTDEGQRPQRGQGPDPIIQVKGPAADVPADPPPPCSAWAARMPGPGDRGGRVEVGDRAAIGELDCHPEHLADDDGPVTVYRADVRFPGT
jgi:hypothetical protein